MICQLCGNDRPLTYRSEKLELASVCAPCIREKMSWTLQTEDPELRTAIAEAMAWLVKHPKGDYIDAAFVTVADKTRSLAGSRFATGRWPEFVSAVKEATQNWLLLS